MLDVVEQGAGTLDLAGRGAGVLDLVEQGVGKFNFLRMYYSFSNLTLNNFKMFYHFNGIYFEFEFEVNTIQQYF